MAGKKPASWAWAPYTADEFRAVKALWDGKATPAQQRSALEWIIFNACAQNQEPFVQGKPDATANLIGRQSVGRQITAILKTVVRQKSGLAPKPD